MNNIININELRKNKFNKAKNNVEEVCQWGFKGLLGNLYEKGFPIMDEDFQQDLALAFKFISAAVGKKYGLESPYIDALKDFERMKNKSKDM